MKTVFVDWKFNLIQQVRLVHAMAEAGVSVAIQDREKWKFQELVRVFGLRFAELTDDSIEVTSALKLVHREPKTIVGDLERPLIFPRGIAHQCRCFWSEVRNTRVGFQGLITGKRKELLTHWIRNNCPGQVRKIRGHDSVLWESVAKIKRKLGMTSSSTINVGPLQLSLSDRGRAFPVKAWDEGYFRTLANSKFTLCPSGDCIWSYRFFEAALCGSIPIVEEVCEVYEGFRFHSFCDNLEALRWSKEDALHNFEKSIELLTTERSDMVDAVARILIHG